MGKHKSTDYKLSTVEYYLNEQKSLSYVCDIFNCSKYSIVRWVKRYIETGNVNKIPRKEGLYKVRQKHVDYIIKLIKKSHL